MKPIIFLHVAMFLFAGDCIGDEQNQPKSKLTETFFKAEGFMQPQDPNPKIGLEKKFKDRKSLVDFMERIGIDYEKQDYYRGKRGSVVERKIFKHRGFFFHVTEYPNEKTGESKNDSIIYKVFVDRS